MSTSVHTTQTTKIQRGSLQERKLNNDAKLSHWAKNPQLLFHVFSYLNALELETALKTCQLFYTVATDERKWLELVVAKWGPHATYFHPLDLNRKRPKTVKGTEYRAFYFRPKAQWRNIYKAREMMTDLYRNGDVHVMKHYNQADIKILSMTADTLKNAKLNQSWTSKKQPKPVKLSTHTRGNTFDLDVAEADKRSLGGAIPLITENDEDTDDDFLANIPVVEVEEPNELPIATSLPEGPRLLRKSHSFDVNSHGTSSTTKLAVLDGAQSFSVKKSTSKEEIAKAEILSTGVQSIDDILDFEALRSFADEGVWKNCGFHLIDCKLLDGQITLNCRKNFNHVEQPFRRRYSYDLMVYSLLSSKSIHSMYNLELLNNKSIDASFCEQWSSAVYNVSSSFHILENASNTSGYFASNKDQSPQNWQSNILGVPCTYPSYGSYPANTWSPASRTGSVEFVELLFKREVYVQRVEIFETFNPGCVTMISVMNKETNHWESVWSGNPTKVTTNCRARIFAPPLRSKLFKTNLIRIDFDTRPYNSWCEIDGVKICGTTDIVSTYQHQHRKEKNQRQLTEIDPERLLGIEVNVGERKDGIDQMDTIQLTQQQHVTHFPFDSTHASPVDYAFGLAAFSYTSSISSHVTDTLVVVGASPMFKDQLFLEARYTRDFIIAIKLIRNMTCMVVVKQMKAPMAYHIHIWDLTQRKLIKTWETKSLTGLLNNITSIPIEPSENKDRQSAPIIQATDTSLWELTEPLVACGIGNRVLVFDVSSNSVGHWHQLFAFMHGSTVMCLSLNDEMRDVTSIIATGSVDRTCKIWSLHSGKCLSTIPHPSPVTSVKLIACGALVATCCIDNGTIRIFDTRAENADTIVTNCIRKINVFRGTVPTKHLGIKSLSFDGRYFTYFGNGTNEFCLARFQHKRKKAPIKQLAFNHYTLMEEAATNDGSCTIL
jgi:hypothetical protein